MTDNRSLRFDKDLQSPLNTIADRIADEVRPTTTLVVGNTIRAMVETLLQHGVEAFGVSTASVTDSLPRKYDLILCADGLRGLSLCEADRAVENLCQHSDDVLFVSNPFEYAGTFLDVPSPEYWSEVFARYGFFRDLDWDTWSVTSQAIRFRRASGPVEWVIAAYDHRVWQLERESQARRELNITQRNELQSLTTEVKVLREQVEAWQARWAALESGILWPFVQRLQNLRAWLAPPGSKRERWLEALFRKRQSLTGGSARSVQVVQVDEVGTRAPLGHHTTSADIIICVHNALADIRCCLNSVVRHTRAPYTLILVDDGSKVQTRDYLIEFAEKWGATLLRNENAQGYTRAANQGLGHSLADYVVLLNSDCVVTPDWLDRLIACAEFDSKIGMVGPLSNRALWQSIPKVDRQGEGIKNSLPEGVTIEEMGALVAEFSARLYPSVPFLNGFCLLIRRALIEEIAYFDQDNFAGYGQDYDYALRARKAGWRLALADDAYVYRAESHSHSDEQEMRSSDRALTVLVAKYDQQLVNEDLATCLHDRVLEGIRARSRVMLEQREWINEGRTRFVGRRLLFILPVMGPGGGANVIVSEAMAMLKMGVKVEVFNLLDYREGFERAYPGLKIPVVYGQRGDVIDCAPRYDAIIATYNPSVSWMSPIERRDGRPIRGYYVQGFEPYMYAPGSPEYQTARDSYVLFQDLVRVTKTEWTRQQVQREIGVDSVVVGPSVAIDLFRPRPRSGPEWPERPLRIAAMVRPGSPYRSPRMTMEVLRKACRRYKDKVEIVIFGTSPFDPGLTALPRDFDWKLAGVLNQKQVARLLNEVDIFVDFSSHQAMGLTAMEAMACGNAVIVPENGGAVSFARHEENSFVIDTSSSQACWHALQRLIEDHELRARLQRNALFDIVNFGPERAAFNILGALFDQAELRRL